MVTFLRTVVVLCALGMATAVMAQSTFEQDFDALSQQLAKVNADAGDNPFARLERVQAAQALEAAGLARKRDRDDALALAAIQISIADYSVRTAFLSQQSQQLDRERDAILLEASRRDAELARQEAERLRLQVLAREEEEALAAAAAEEPAADAADMPDPATQNLSEAQRKEAALARLEEELSQQIAHKGDVLAKRTGPGPSGYILSGAAFQPGKATLNADARVALQQLAKRLKSTGKSWDILGFTDNLGDEDSNIQLSRKRAEVVLSLFRAAGIASARLSAAGKGSAQPVASNASKAGRAQNRRVEILQK